MKQINKKLWTIIRTDCDGTIIYGDKGNKALQVAPKQTTKVHPKRSVMAIMANMTNEEFVEWMEAIDAKSN